MSETWVPRCSRCGHTNILLMPMPCGPEKWNGVQPRLYCSECQQVYEMSALSKLYVRL